MGPLVFDGDLLGWCPDYPLDQLLPLRLPRIWGARCPPTQSAGCGSLNVKLRWAGSSMACTHRQCHCQKSRLCEAAAVMDHDICPGQRHTRALAKSCCSPPNGKASKWPGAVKGAPNGAAERTLDGEDHFATTNEGENSATIPGAEIDPVNGNYREPLHAARKAASAGPWV